MSEMVFEQLQYEFAEIWDEDWFGEDDFERVKQLATLIPVGTDTLLDVGCGNGLFLNHVQRTSSNRFQRLVGVDRSEAALEKVETDKYQSSADALPFADREFTTVTSMEMLEHLPLAIYSKAVGEIARVAKDHLLICVPYNQDLLASQCQCPVCLTSFNPDYHMRSFDEQAMAELFTPHGFQMTGTHYLGEDVIYYDRALRQQLRNGFKKEAPVYPSYAVCPVCGYFDQHRLSEDLANRKRAKDNASRRTAVHRPATGIRAALRNILPKYSHYRWIAATYQRIER